MSVTEIANIMKSEGPNYAIMMSRDDLVAFANMLLDSKGLSGGGDEWLSVEEVCRKFGLSINKVRRASWRKKNNFPVHQPGGAYCKLSFSSREVAKWLSRK